MKKVNIFISLIVLIMFTFLGCSKEGNVNNDVPENVPLNKIQENESSILTFYGKWIVSKAIAYSPVFALEDEEIKEFIGKEVEFNVNFARYEDNVCENPNYELESISQNNFIDQNNIYLQDINVTNESIVEVTIYDKEKMLWNNSFCVIYVKNQDTLIVNNGGVYFELLRRALDFSY